MRSACLVCGLFATAVLSGCGGENNESNVLNTKGAVKVEATGPPVTNMEEYAKQRQAQPSPYAGQGYPGSKSGRRK